jgi:hypothetical protein
MTFVNDQLDISKEHVTLFIWSSWRRQRAESKEEHQHFANSINVKSMWSCDQKRSSEYELNAADNNQSCSCSSTNALRFIRNCSSLLPTLQIISRVRWQAFMVFQSTETNTLPLGEEVPHKTILAKECFKWTKKLLKYMNTRHCARRRQMCFWTRFP